MAALPSTGMFDLPELVEIAQTEDAQKFVLRSMLADQALLPPPSVAPQSAVPAQGAEQASAPVSASQSEAK